MKRQLILSLLLAIAAYAQQSATFIRAGNMTVPRAGHTATLLHDGRVLIAGGYTDENDKEIGRAITATAEIFDPARGAFSQTGQMTVPRSNHTATLLPDGRVLIVGGDQVRPLLEGSTSAEIYDPASGRFTTTGSMTIPRSNHSAILLANGRVLISGGGTFASAPNGEVYDARTGSFTETISVPGTVDGTPSLLLPDGKVFTLGSLQPQLYDPGTRALRSTAATTPMFTNPISLLPDGRVLLAGGDDDMGASTRAMVFDPATERFADTGKLNSPRSSFTVTLLPDGKTLFTGGRTIFPAGQERTYACCLSSAELYDPSAGAFTAAGNMTTRRSRHVATLLADGRVLITGGSGGDPVGVLASAELYTPVARVAAPQLFSLESEGQVQGAIWHASTGAAVSQSNPASGGEVLSIYTNSLIEGGVIPPQVVIGGRIADVDYFGAAPGYPGYYQVNFRLPGGAGAGSAVPVHLTYIGRSSNQVSLSVQE